MTGITTTLFLHGSAATPRGLQGRDARPLPCEQNSDLAHRIHDRCRGLAADAERLVLVLAKMDSAGFTFDMGQCWNRPRTGLNIDCALASSGRPDASSVSVESWQRNSSTCQRSQQATTSSLPARPAGRAALRPPAAHRVSEEGRRRTPYMSPYLLKQARKNLESVRTFYVTPAYLTIRRSMSRIIARMINPAWLRLRFS